MRPRGRFGDILAALSMLANACISTDIALTFGPLCTHDSALVQILLGLRQGLDRRLAQSLNYAETKGCNLLFWRCYRANAGPGSPSTPKTACRQVTSNAGIQH